MTSLNRRFSAPGELGDQPPGAAGRQARRCDPAPEANTPVSAEPSRPAAAPLHELRGKAMRRMFPKLFHWRAGRPERSIALEVHAYLAQATSTADLELRIGTAEHRVRFGN
jgi:hypothetical protein